MTWTASIACWSRSKQGQSSWFARDTREPSPFCYELLNADPYAFLDGGEIAERRTRAVATRRSLTVESVSDLGRLDPEAIDRVIEEARPIVRSDDELHDVLLSRIVVPVESPSDLGIPSPSMDDLTRGEGIHATCPNRRWKFSSPL